MAHRLVGGVGGQLLRSGAVLVFELLNARVEGAALWVSNPVRLFRCEIEVMNKLLSTSEAVGCCAGAGHLGILGEERCIGRWHP